MERKHILILDDDERMLRALGKVLRGAGAEVMTTTRAEDAIEILIRREKNMDLVITDLRMPIVNGVTVVQAVHLIFPGIPVIVLTAFGTPELQGECLCQGAAAFLEKTMSAEQLIAAVNKVFNSQKACSNDLVEAA